MEWGSGEITVMASGNGSSASSSAIPVQKPWLKNVWGQKKVWQSKPAVPLPDDFHIDTTARYRGTVSSYYKWQGCGTIGFVDEGIVPTDRVFVHWSNIQSEDRYPSLMKGMQVEFGLMRWKNRDKTDGTVKTTLRAKHVTLPDGANIALQDEHDRTTKTFVGGQEIRYTGRLKWFDSKKGIGYVSLDEGYELPEPVQGDLLVETNEVNCGPGKKPWMLDDLAVEFGIWKTSQGQQRVYNMTLPGGLAITQDALEHRQVVLGGRWSGEVAKWVWKHGFGFIRPDVSPALPSEVQEKLAQMQQAAMVRNGKGQASASVESLVYFRKQDCMPDCHADQGLKVMFGLYIDDKGAGACNVESASASASEDV